MKQSRAGIALVVVAMVMVTLFAMSLGRGWDDDRSKGPITRIAAAEESQRLDAQMHKRAAEPGQHDTGPSAETSATSFPAGTEPAEVIVALLPAAKAGNASAACRIALERLACDEVEDHGKEIQTHLDREEQRALERARVATDQDMQRLLTHRANRYAALQAAMIERKGACARIPPSIRKESTDWLERAAMAGHPEAVLRYAKGQSLGVIEGVETDEWSRFHFMGKPGFDAWRRQAPAALHRMLAGGRPEAALVLYFAYLNDETPLNGLIPNDPVEAAAMQLVLRDASSMASPSDPLRGLDPRQRQAAIARHAALRESISGRKTDLRLINQGTDTPWMSLVPTPGNDPPPCEG